MNHNNKNIYESNDRIDENIIKSSNISNIDKPLSWNDIKLAQNLIEICLQQYMTQSEIIGSLQIQANIEPDFTRFVWQKLEEQNKLFFHAYNIQLKLKDQIMAFNYLVDQQNQLMQKINNFNVSNIQNNNTIKHVSMNGYNTNNNLNSENFIFQQPSRFFKTENNPLITDLTDTKDLVIINEDNNNKQTTTEFPMISPIKSDLDTHAFFT